ncbi:MAG: peptidase M13 [Rhodoluna sp.]|nr:peptidase M13 [Rhodoluna sp.]
MTIKPGLDVASFDTNTRPQDDLFRHTNGKWLDEVEIPADQATYGSFMILRDLSEERVREILEDAAANPQPGVSQKIGDMYGSFLNEARANEFGKAPIADELDRIAKISSIAELNKLLGEFSVQGIDGLFGMYVNNDPGNPERYLVNIYQGGLGLPDESYYREEKYAEFRDAYLPYIAQMLELAGWSAADAAESAKKIFEFETTLATHHWNVVETRDAEKTYNLQSFDKLQETSGNYDWQLWLDGAQLEKRILAETVVMTPSFFTGLGSMFSDENLDALKAWLSFNVINQMAPYLSADFVNTRFEFYGRKLTGQPEMRARWKRAVQAVEGSLGEAVGEIYVQKHFPPAAKARMDSLVQNLIEAYRESILALEWMTDETKKKALVKLDKFTPKIGYPVKWRDYSELEIDRDDLVGNMQRVARFVTKIEVAKIGSPIDRDEWFMTPQTVNAYYNPGFNEIVFPASILQPPFFSLDADDAVNYGAIGAVIGHEIGHGFDDQGSKYDGDGALQSWWTDADRAAFETRTKNLIDQYAELSPAQLDDSHKVNGELTIGENIGDLGGLSIAYKAYMNSLNGKEADEIDGYTGQQRLFLSWGQAWRGKGRDELVIQRLATDPHSPNEFRCNQIVRNLDAFYEAFDVKPGDKLWLDESQRVTIW